MVKLIPRWPLPISFVESALEIFNKRLLMMGLTINIAKTLKGRPAATPPHYVERGLPKFPLSM